jgi:predicted ABC-type ATPase
VNRPSFTLIAGANGSGKSTLTNSNPDIFGSFPILDPDAIARTIQSTITASSAIMAGRQALQIAKQLLHDQKSFAVETTLSGKNYLQMMLDARNLGFEVVLVYIGTETVEINLARIINRVLVGGHDVPESDVRRRYQRSLKNAPIAISRADHVIIFDNSTEQGYQLVGVIDQGQNEWLEPLPKWAIGLQHHLPSEHSA